MVALTAFLALFFMALRVRRTPPGYRGPMRVDANQTERDVKFAVDRDFDPPDLRFLIGRTVRLPEEQLSTTYFDTPDMRLWNRGITLRHRSREGCEEGTWTLKLPDQGSGPVVTRSELTWPGGRQEVPMATGAILRGVVRRAGLGEVTELATNRRRLALQTGDDEEAWGEIDDDLVTIVGGPNDGLRFRQIEVELRPGRPGVADSVLDRLRSRGARITKQPKLSLALGHPPSEADQRRQTKSKRRRETFADTVQLAIATGLDRLLDHDFRVRLDLTAPDPAGVHQMRVAARRLRSNLKTFGPALDPVWLGHVTEDLRWIGAALGRVRDVDVLAERFQASGCGAHGPSGGHLELMGSLDRQRSDASRQLAAALCDDRYLDLLDRLQSAAHGAPLLRGAAARTGGGAVDPDGASRDALPSLVKERWRSLERGVRKAGADPSDRRLHRMRIKAKRLRYASEAATPVIGKPAARTAAAAEDVQTVLGELHDAVCAQEWLRRELERPDLTPAAAFAAGNLSHEQHLAQLRLRRRWRSAYKRLRRKQNRAWLHR